MSDAPTPTSMSDEERAALVAEADAQTKAIIRLDLYKRIAYIMLGVGALGGYWAFQTGASGALKALFVVLMVVFGVASLVLYVGIGNAKDNVRAMMTSAGYDMSARKKGKDHPSKE